MRTTLNSLLTAPSLSQASFFVSQFKASYPAILPCSTNSVFHRYHLAALALREYVSRASYFLRIPYTENWACLEYIPLRRSGLARRIIDGPLPCN